MVDPTNLIFEVGDVPGARRLLKRRVKRFHRPLGHRDAARRGRNTHFDARVHNFQ